MGKKISASDLFESVDLFAGIKQSAQETIQSLEKIDAEFKSIAQTLKSTIGKTKFDSNKSIKEFIQLTERANKLAQESAKLESLKTKAIEQEHKAEQQLERVKQQKIKTTQLELRLARQRQQEAERQAKADERAKKQALDEANAYKQLEKATRELKNESKRLGAEMLILEQQGKKNSAQYRQLATTYDAVTRKAQEGDAQLKKLDKTVGDNFRNVGNYRDALNKLSMGLGALGIGIGVGSVLRTGADAILDFNQQVADLQAITGASGDDLKYFSEQANKLGMDVEGGASAVVEAYKLIGSAKPELLENASALNAVAESAITLSQASGMGLQESATALTDAMNQFGASADQADKFVNVLANGAKFGSAEIPQITEALLKFGSVAKSTGTSVEESTAMIELLAEKGLKGAEAGTALRNVMLKLSAPDALPREAKKRLEELGISLTELANPTLTMTEKLKMLAPLMKDNGALVKTFGTENATASLALIQNIDRIEELNGQMDTQGTHLEQAQIRTNTLGHALMELKNAFLGLFTSMGSGDGAMQGFIDGIKWIAKNLTTIMEIIWKVVRTWIIYKTTIKAIQAQQWIMNGGFKQLGRSLMAQIPMTRAYRMEQILLARAQRTVGESATTSATAMKTAGNTMKAIPWVLIISSLVELYNWWVNVASASAEARRQADLYKNAQEQGSIDAQKVSEQTRKNYDEEIRKNELLYRTKIANAKGEAEKNKLANEMASKNIEIQKRYAKEANQRAHAIQDERTHMKELKAEWEAIHADPQGGLGKWSVEQSARMDEIFRDLDKHMGKQLRFGYFSENMDMLTSKFGAMNSQIIQLNEDYKYFNDTQEESTVQLLEQKQSQNDYSVKINKSTESYKGLNTQAQEFNHTLSEVNDYLQESLKLMQELEEISQNRQVLKLTKEIEDLIDKSVDYAELGQLPMGLPDLKQYPKDATDLEKKRIDEENLQTLIANNGKLNRLIDEQTELQKNNLKQRNEFYKSQLDIENNLAKEKEYNKLLEDRDKLLAQEGIKTADKEKIMANFKERVKELDVEFAQMDEDVRLKKLVADEKLADDQKKLDDDMVKTKEDTNKRILEGWKNHLKEKEDAEKKANDDELAREKQKAEDRKAIAQGLYDFLKELSDRRIAKMDEEISKATAQLEHYKKLAEEGNINASQSLAEQQKIIDEANRKKMIEERRMAMLELAKTAYATYQDKVANKSKKPLADTIRDITLLQAFIKSIPAFEEGTEDTGKNGRGVDGKGGFHAILHPNERVIPKALNEQIGDLSNTELARIANNYRAGKIGDATQTRGALDFAILVNEIKDLKSVVKHKPETNIELGEITTSMMEIVHSVKKGGKTTYNRFKIQK